MKMEAFWEEDTQISWKFMKMEAFGRKTPKFHEISWNEIAT